MSSHHARATILRHYQQEENARVRRQEANKARREAFEANRKAIQLEVLWWQTSLTGWALAWLVAVASITIFALRMAARLAQ